MELKAYFKNKARHNAVTILSDTKSYIRWGFSFAINNLHRTHSINKRAVDIKYMELRGK